jgi:hypothetical protein
MMMMMMASSREDVGGPTTKASRLRKRRARKRSDNNKASAVSASLPPPVRASSDFISFVPKLKATTTRTLSRLLPSDIQEISIVTRTDNVVIHVGQQNRGEDSTTRTTTATTTATKKKKKNNNNNNNNTNKPVAAAAVAEEEEVVHIEMTVIRKTPLVGWFILVNAVLASSAIGACFDRLRDVDPLMKTLWRSSTLLCFLVPWNLYNHHHRSTKDVKQWVQLHMTAHMCRHVLQVFCGYSAQVPPIIYYISSSSSSSSSSSKYIFGDILIIYISIHL